MATLKDLNTIASDAAFQGRCMAALRDYAMGVMAESRSTTDHNARADYARRVIAGQEQAFNVAAAVLTNDTIAAESSVAAISTDAGVPDGDIIYTVTQIFNALAGLANN